MKTCICQFYISQDYNCVAPLQVARHVCDMAFRVFVKRNNFPLLGILHAKIYSAYPALYHDVEASTAKHIVIILYIVRAILLPVSSGFDSQYRVAIDNVYCNDCNEISKRMSFVQTVKRFIV